MSQEIKVMFKDGRESVIVPELNLHNIRRIHGDEILNIEYVDGENPEMKFIGLEAVKEKEVVELTDPKESLTELEDQNFDEGVKESKKEKAIETQSKKKTGSKKSKTKQAA